MSRETRSTLMFSPGNFVKLLGEEYHLMRDAGVLRRFYISSLVIIIILLLTGISITYALDLLFHVITIEITLAIFFGLLFFCIYIFLLNTFAKENRKQRGILNLSNIIRAGFVAFMGFLVAQPLIILLYTNALSPAVENYKQEILTEHAAKIEDLASKEATSLVNKWNYYDDQKKRFGTPAYDKELVKIGDRLKKIHNKTTDLQRIAQQTIDRNSFFLFRVQTVNRRYPLAWLLTSLIVLLFLLPGYLVYTISSQHIYYIMKKAREREIISTAFQLFGDRYKTMFNEQLTIFSRYEDPPFNTVRKQQPVAASIADFFQKYINNG